MVGQKDVGQVPEYTVWLGEVEAANVVCHHSKSWTQCDVCGVRANVVVTKREADFRVSRLAGTVGYKYVRMFSTFGRSSSYALPQARVSQLETCSQFNPNRKWLPTGTQ